MRRLWNEFKSFAMSGNMLDLALGFIIGAAFAKIIDSMVGNVLMQLVAIIFGQPDFTELTINWNGGVIKYGAFLTDLVNFLLLVALLFGVVKFIVFVGVGRGRPMTTKQCPYCHEEVQPNALICRFCHSQLVDEMPDLGAARTRLAELNRRKLSLPLPIPGRRKEPAEEIP
jgi:large conductance mechanosensitive channel